MKEACPAADVPPTDPSAAHARHRRRLPRSSKQHKRQRRARDAKTAANAAIVAEASSNASVKKHGVQDLMKSNIAPENAIMRDYVWEEEVPKLRDLQEEDLRRNRYSRRDLLLLRLRTKDLL